MYEKWESNSKLGGVPVWWTKINSIEVDKKEIIVKLHSELKKQKIELEREKLVKETTIPEERWGVHETHCCEEHGCKYGNEDCPVVIGLIKQRYRCEFCSCHICNNDAVINGYCIDCYFR